MTSSLESCHWCNSALKIPRLYLSGPNFKFLVKKLKRLTWGPACTNQLVAGDSVTWNFQGCWEVLRVSQTMTPRDLLLSASRERALSYPKHTFYIRFFSLDLSSRLNLNMMGAEGPAFKSRKPILGANSVQKEISISIPSSRGRNSSSHSNSNANLSHVWPVKQPSFSQMPLYREQQQLLDHSQQSDNGPHFQGVKLKNREAWQHNVHMQSHQ